jgi:acetyl-CoA carboxylase carboxyl transferase subunit alpha
VAVKEQIAIAFNELKNLPEEELVAQRMDKYAKMGVYKE